MAVHKQSTTGKDAQRLCKKDSKLARKEVKRNERRNRCQLPEGPAKEAADEVPVPELKEVEALVSAMARMDLSKERAFRVALT
jgi:hypothetical protein